MIIAGFAGVGKTYFCKKNKNAIDFIIMPFKYTDFYQVSKGLSEDEEIKASEDLIYQVGWEEYYYYALMDTYKKYPDEMIVIPTIGSVLKRLKRDNIPVTIVYPNVSDKGVYEKRYKERGNSATFLELFIENWEKWVKASPVFFPENAIELKSNEYLSDVISTTAFNESKIIVDKETYIYDRYFRNGWNKEFLETPHGKILSELKKRYEKLNLY